MAVQRTTNNLGYNRSKDRERIFQHIEKVLKIKKKLCSRGNCKEKHPRYGFLHTGPNPLVIRDFNLLGSYIGKEGNVVISKGDGLQTNCRNCEIKFRAGRTNRNRKRYLGMTHEQIGEEYRKNYGRKLKKCSMCKIEKAPEEFAISLGMECGLHNTCMDCARSYTEATGSRWEILSPDGHMPLKINNLDSCIVCGTKTSLSKDHIFPLSKGGTDNIENLQVLCRHHNSSKSDTIISPIIKNVSDIKDKMICERYNLLLKEARMKKWTINEFEIRVSDAVKKFILWKSKLSDPELRKFFEMEKQRNNRKHGIEHSVKKFRQYCSKARIEKDDYAIETNLD